MPTAKKSPHPDYLVISECIADLPAASLAHSSLSAGGVPDNMTPEKGTFNNSDECPSAASRFAPHAACCQSDAEPVFEDVYEIIEGSRCGYGSSSTVVKVRRRSDGDVFACKIPNNTEREQSQARHRDEIRHEVEIMKMLGARMMEPRAENDSTVDPCVTTCIDALASRNADDSPSTMYMVLELMKGGDLRSSLARQGNYTEGDARTVMKQLLCALVFLHDEAGVTHRDIKLDNILLPSEVDHATIKLSDFGLSAAGTSTTPSMTRRCGTLLYAAPELITESSSSYGNKVDLWSSGVVMFMLLCGFPPFWGSSKNKLLMSISRARANFTYPAWQHISGEGKALVQKLLETDPSKRLSAREALLHPWFIGSAEGQ